MALQVQEIIKKYGENTVVDRLSFTMENPGVYALLGRNGAGKTTTIRIILGMLASDGGSVLWNGKPLDPMQVNVGYLAEERGLYPKYTLMDQLLYFARLKNMSAQEAKQQIAYWAKKLEVEEYLYPATSVKNSGAGKKKKIPSRKADELSKGNQQKIQLMAALISDPDLIVMDEPLSGLDPVNADLFKQIIHECIERGKYIIMSSHQMPTIEEFCSDITILNRGQAVVQGNLNEIKKSYGRVNLFVKADSSLDPYISKMNLTVQEKTPDGYHLKVTGEAQAAEFLRLLVTEQVPIVKYELREPSLHEIFVEKVGADNA